MDEFYDQQKAGIRLDGIVCDRGPVGSELSNSELYLATAQLKQYTVQPFMQLRAWRLCSCGGPSHALEEAAFRIQGVLCGKDLPPVVLPGNRSARMRARKFMRQNVKLTGFGNANMVESIKQIEAVYVKMSNQFKEGTLEGWQPAAFEGNPAIEANTRYFTQVAHATPADSTDFAPHVDHDGQLRELMGGDYVHTTDNCVDYMEQVRTSEGGKCYRAVDPVIFKNGDLVEASVSFAVMQTKNKTAKFHILLRALVLLDHTERDAAAILRMRRRYQTMDSSSVYGVPPRLQPVLKRRLMYSEADVDAEEANRSLSRMRIDGPEL